MRIESRARIVSVVIVTVVLVVASPGAQAGDTWQWSLTPYMWATDISEDPILDGVVDGSGDVMWTAQGLLGWRFGANRSSGVFSGYRYRDMEHGRADVFGDQKTLSGFGLGVRFGF